MYKQIILLLSLLFIASQSMASSGSSASGSPQALESGSAAPEIKGGIEFMEPWARASMSPNNNSAVYLVIKNTSDSMETLIGASAIDVANNVELHQSFVDEKGVSKMIPVGEIVIPAKTEVALKPGGIHIMLFDLKSSLKSGDKFKLDLKFKSLGTKSIDVEVRSNG